MGHEAKEPSRHGNKGRLKMGEQSEWFARFKEPGIFYRACLIEQDQQKWEEIPPAIVKAKQEDVQVLGEQLIAINKSLADIYTSTHSSRVSERRGSVVHGRFPEGTTDQLQQVYGVIDTVITRHPNVLADAITQFVQPVLDAESEGLIYETIEAQILRHKQVQGIHDTLTGEGNLDIKLASAKRAFKEAGLEGGMYPEASEIARNLCPDLPSFYAGAKKNPQIDPERKLAELKDKLEKAALVMAFGKRVPQTPQQA